MTSIRSNFAFSDAEKDAAVKDFKQYLGFRTISFEGPGSGEYKRCVTFLEELCRSCLPGCKTEIFDFFPNKPLLFVEVPGKDPSLPGLLLNSHYDVVPIVDSEWHVPAFEGIEKDGKIFGRGTQDMKCVSIQYIHALKKAGELNRTVFLTFVPDEEIGGFEGMGGLIRSPFFTTLKPRIGLAFDEGLSSGLESDSFTVFYGERMPLWIKILAEGPTGHGSRFVKDTAPSKLMKVVNKALAKRDEQEQRLSEGCKHCEALKLGDVLTLNLTVLQTGVQAEGKYAYNVIPNEAQAGFDIRVPVTLPLPQVYALLDEWCEEDGVSWSFASFPEGEEPYEHFVSDTDSVFWQKFQEVCEWMGAPLKKAIFPAGTDSRFLREAGIQAFGFSPIRRQPVLLHEHNEYLSRESFLEGVDVYANLLQSIGNMA